MPKGKQGRPTKFEPKYCQMLIDFFKKPLFEEETIEHYNKDGEVSFTETRRHANPLPTLEQFATDIGVTDDSVVNWAKEENVDKYPGFFAAYTYAKELQKDFLVQNGLAGRYNSNFAIFVAKNFTNMRDKTEVEHTGEVSLTHLLHAAAEKRKQRKSG